MSTSAHRYIHADTPYDDELPRLRLLEGRYDEVTRRRLGIAGDLTGARCLEVGAGAGSVVRMLAEAVGPAGEVVATDADPRFLAELDLPQVTVRRHDIVTDDLEQGGFDLVHCRALLLHLSDPERALRRMAAALRPGGWLLAEDADFCSLAAADDSHPRAADFNRVTTAITNGFMHGSLDPWFGARLPGMVDALGLELRGDEAPAFERVGGGVEARLFIHSFGLSRDSMLAAGTCSEAELTAVLAAFADPTFAFVDSLSVAAWGRRSLPGFLG